MQIIYTQNEIGAAVEFSRAYMKALELPNADMAAGMSTEELLKVSGFVHCTDNTWALEVPEEQFVKVTELLTNYVDELVPLAKAAICLAESFKRITKRLERELAAVFK